MIGIIVKFINKSISILGYQVRKIPDKNTTSIKINIPDDPGSLLYSLKFSNYYLSLPLHKAKALTIPLDQKNYFIAAKRAIQAEEKEEFHVIKESLTSYYRNALPDSASEVLGLHPGEVPELDHEPAWLNFYPWHPDTISTMRSAGDKRRGDKKSGSSGIVNSMEELINFDSKRTYKLYKSLQHNGYIHDLNKINSVRAQLLINEENEYVWLINGGFHRTAISYALGLKEIEVNLKNVINRADVEKWPAVHSGIFDKETALKVFDNIFYSKGLKKNDEWISDFDF
jgi:hypothetical protein